MLRRRILFLIMLLFYIPITQAGDREGNPQLIVILEDAKEVPFEIAMQADTREYNGIYQLPNGDGSNEFNPKFDKSYKKDFLDWIEIIRGYSAELADQLMALAAKNDFIYVNRMITFPIENYPQDKFPVKYHDQYAAAVYYMDKVYISMPAMNRLTPFDGLTKKQMQGFVLVHEMINAIYTEESKNIRERLDSSFYQAVYGQDTLAYMDQQEGLANLREKGKNLLLKKLRLGQFIVELLTRNMSKLDFHFKLALDGHQYWISEDTELKRLLIKRAVDYGRLETLNSYAEYSDYVIYLKEYFDFCEQGVNFRTDVKKSSSFDVLYRAVQVASENYGIIESVELFHSFSYQDFVFLIDNFWKKSELKHILTKALWGLPKDYQIESLGRVIKYLKKYLAIEITNECSSANFTKAKKIYYTTRFIEDYNSFWSISNDVDYGSFLEKKKVIDSCIAKKSYVQHNKSSLIAMSNKLDSLTLTQIANYETKFEDYEKEHQVDLSELNVLVNELRQNYCRHKWRRSCSNKDPYTFKFRKKKKYYFVHINKDGVDKAYSIKYSPLKIELNWRIIIPYRAADSKKVYAKTFFTKEGMLKKDNKIILLQR